LSVVSVQTGAPVAQTFDAFLHGFPVIVQAVPPAQATHAPSLQTMSVPQTMPFGCAACVSEHDASPVAEHMVCPTWHGLAGRQALPGVHVIPPSTSLDPPAPATAPPVVPATDPPVVPAIDPALPALPALPPLPVLLPPVEPPRPAAPTGLNVPPAPPLPAVPVPVGDSGSSRSPQPRVEQPRRTDTNTARFSIISP
jgi:hypothetical protein